MVTGGGKILTPIFCDQGETLSLCHILFFKYGQKNVNNLYCILLSLAGFIHIQLREFDVMR